MLNLPPRHGKSEFTTRYFPAWFLGRRPDKRVIICGYGDNFSRDWGRKVRDLVQEFGPRWFDVQVRSDSKAADQWNLEDHTGGLIAVGIGGQLVGRGADLMVIDDPIKNPEEANSEVYREKTWDWYVAAAYSRLEPGASLILIQTRWHSDDLAGRVLERAKETGERWDVIDLPALAMDDDVLGRPPGTALWPDRYDEHYLDVVRKTQGTYWFSAMYQGRPVPESGGLFKREWMRYWRWEPGHEGKLFRLLVSRNGQRERLVELRHCRRFGTVDLAFSTRREGNYTVVGAFAVTPEFELVWLDIVRERMEGPQLVPAIRAMCRKWELEYVGIERVMGQDLIAHGIRLDGVPVRGLLANTDKVTRSIPAQVRMEAGQVFLPERHELLDVMEREILTFDKGANDDIVDCLSYAATDMQRFGAPAEPEDVRAARRRQAEEQAERERQEKGSAAYLQQRMAAAQADPDLDGWYEGWSRGAPPPRPPGTPFPQGHRDDAVTGWTTATGPPRSR